ncbi:hypothetical protein FRX31_013006 [Thalictrum thalictroides]|uniref:RNase H type-1 domain-containing protein n=1 Tax=Thalictrum thalictroides TaxID=46969 RepID=A0A7J6WKH2_THATH|nr:hypothetical protein FRX31_013006 [Thalictrum thalictroides]
MVLVLVILVLQSAGSGGVIRNEYGQVLGWYSLQIGHTSTNNIAEEWMTIIYGFKLATDLNIHRYYLLVEAIQMSTKVVDTITQQCRKWMKKIA